MRTLSVVLSVLLLAMTARAQESEKVFLDIEAKRRAAIAAKDFTTLATIYAEDFRGIIGSGEIADRAFLFEVFRHDDPTVKFTTDELVVRQFGEAAIVTGRLTATRDEAIFSQQRFSHFFARRKGRWQIVAAEGTPVRAPVMPAGKGLRMDRKKDDAARASAHLFRLHPSSFDTSAPRSAT